MKRFFLLLGLIAFASITVDAAPLRVFIRGGKKSHGPNQHEHERFLNDWKKLLGERGITVDGAMDWPTAEQFAVTDVLVMYAQEGGNAKEEDKQNMNKFIQRGGGVVVIHTASVSSDPPWWKSVIGGAWVHGKTAVYEGMMDLYYQDHEHPITKGASNFYIDDEIYYDMDISPDVRVLATSYTPKASGDRKAPNGKVSIFDIQPQMWTYEKTAEGGTQPYRAFVSIPGHLYTTFEQPFYRAILLRAIAWTGKRENADEFCNSGELAALRYPEGGPSSPQDELVKLEVHPDFTMKLVASEPLINKPINFDWDADGRLWVAETPEYPNGRRGMRPDYRGKEWKDHGGLVPEAGIQQREGRDKISILTDTNGDGEMDKKEVFYEGLDLVTGLVFHKDGVIVTQAPDVLFLRDTNGDGKADKVEKLYTNLGTTDTHAVINNPRWGWDGWIYATHGYASSDDVKSGDGSKSFGRIGAGVVRFRPDGSAFEQYTSKGCNTWGLTITADNRVMWTQPTCGHLLMQTILPESLLARGRFGKTSSDHVVMKSPKSFPLLTTDEMAYVQIDSVGSFTAASGCEIYDGGSWPSEYNGDFFTTEPTINIIHHERLTPQGVSYSATKLPGREDTEFVRAKDLWFRPIEVRIGPDGGLYVADFYNQAVIHNDTRGPDHNNANASVRPDRDHYFGRIWKLDHKQAKKLEVPKLGKASVAELVKALEHPNRHVRMNAMRLLLERPNPVPNRMTDRGLMMESEQERAESDDALQKNWGFQSVRTLAHDTSKPVEARIAALWVLGHRDRDLKATRLEWSHAIKDKDPAILRNVALIGEEICVEGKAIGGEPVKRSWLWQDDWAPLVNSEHPQVRVAALRTFALSNFGDEYNNPHTPEAVLGAAKKRRAKHAKILIEAWSKFDDDFQKSAAIAAAKSNPSACILASMDSQDSAALSPLIQPLIQTVADKGEVEGAASMIIAFAAKPDGGELQRTILDVLSKSLSGAPKMTPELKAALVKVLSGTNGDSALGVATKWDKEAGLKSEISAVSKRLFGELGDVSASDDVRIKAARNLLNTRASIAEVLPAVLSVVGGNASVSLKKQIISALAETGDVSVGDTLVAAYKTLPAEVQSTAFETLLQRADWSQALIKALETKQLDIAFLKPADSFRLRTHPDKAVAKQAGVMLDALLGSALQAKGEILAKLTPEVVKPGDVVKGKALFTAACATCHKLDDLGTAVGPVLTGMGAHGPADLLIHIVDPNREVEPSYATWNIETKDGQFHAGVISRENTDSLFMKSLAGEVEIKQSDIKSRANTGRSLMPEGFEGLGAESLRDILAFMCSGKDAKYRMADLKEVFTADARQGMFRSLVESQGIPFKQFGTVKVGKVPFLVVDAAASGNGKNVIVLKGGTDDAQSKKAPQRVEIPFGGFKANRLHFLGGIAGWGFKGSGETKDAMKITVVYTDQKTEEIVCKDGVEFVDFLSNVDVPGSQRVPDFAGERQVRTFTKQLGRSAEIEKVVLESFDKEVATVTVAITAELAE